MDLKLNIGSGEKELEGYINLDAKFGHTIFPLNYDSETFIEVRASHILEHFSEREVFDVLKEWIRVLKPEGIIKIAVPDMRWISKELVNNNSKFPTALLYAYIIGGQVDEYDFHKSIFDQNKLTILMSWCKITRIEEWRSDIKDCASLPVSLNLMGRKEK